MGESWSACRIGDAVRREVARVGANPAPVVLSSTKYRGLVPSRTYFKGRKIFSDDLSMYRVVRPGWFAYATNHLAEGSIGLNDLGETGCVSPMYTVFSARDHVYKEYLYRLLKSPHLLDYYQLHEQASVDRRGSIRFRSFAEIPITLPPLEEQGRIVEILDTIDETIQATERVIAKLEFQRQAVSETVFGRDSWRGTTEILSIGNVLSSRPRNGQSVRESASWNGAHILGLGCLTEYGFSPQHLKWAPKITRSLHRALLVDGDLLISRSNTEDRVGFVGRYKSVGTPCLYPDLMMRLRPRKHICVRYLELALQSRPARRQIRNLASGTSGSMLKITGEAVSRLRVPICSPGEQVRCCKAFDALADRRRVEERRLQKLRDLRSGLAADLLSGRVRTVAT